MVIGQPSTPTNGVPEWTLLSLVLVAEAQQGLPIKVGRLTLEVILKGSEEVVLAWSKHRSNHGGKVLDRHLDWYLNRGSIPLNAAVTTWLEANPSAEVFAENSTNHGWASRMLVSNDLQVKMLPLVEDVFDFEKVD